MDLDSRFLISDIIRSIKQNRHKLKMKLIFLGNIYKPKIIFNDNGSIKSYGMKQNQTMYSLGVVSVIISIVSFYFFCIIDLIFN